MANNPYDVNISNTGNQTVTVKGKVSSTKGNKNNPYDRPFNFTGDSSNQDYSLKPTQAPKIPQDQSGNAQSTPKAPQANAPATKPGSGLLHGIATYIKAFATSPGTVVHDLVGAARGDGGGTIKDVNNGAIIVNRAPQKYTDKIAKQQGGGKGSQLDHIVPLEAGGNNDPSNLRIMSKAQDQANNNPENFVGAQLKANVINGTQAKQIMLDYKNGKINADQVYKLASPGGMPKGATLLQKAGNAGKEIVKSVVDVPAEVYRQADKNVFPLFTGKKSNVPKGDNLIKTIDQAKANTTNGKFSANTLKLIKDNPEAASKRNVMAVIADPKSTDQNVVDAINQANQYTKEQNIKGAATAAELASMVSGGGGVAQAVKTGGKALVKPLTTGTLSGAVGGGSDVLRRNPNATAKEVEQGAGAGAALGFVATGAGAAGSKVVKEINNMRMNNATKANLLRNLGIMSDKSAAKVDQTAANIEQAKANPRTTDTLLPKTDNQKATEELINTPNNVINPEKPAEPLSKPFSGSLDKTTSDKITTLKAEADKTPVPAGHTRVYQATGKGMKTDYVFTNPDHLANFKNNTTVPTDNFAFHDVPSDQVKPVNGKPNVYTVKNLTETAKTSPDAVKNTKNNTLYHGTYERFDNFDQLKQKTGNMGKGVYLTDNETAAKYHSLLADRHQLVKEADPKTLQYRDEKLGVVMQTKLADDAKIKKFESMPSKAQVDKARKDGFDGVTYPDSLYSTAEDWNHKLLGDMPEKPNTTLVFDHSKVEVVPEKSVTSKTVKTKPIEKPVTEPTTPKTTSENKQLASKVYERLRAEHPELGDSVTYEHKNLQQDAEKAVDLIATDREKAYRVAMGHDTVDGISPTTVNIAMAEKALQEGNTDLYASLTKHRSLELTRKGQDIAAERASLTDNSTSRYVKELLGARLDKVGKRYLSGLTDKMLKGSPKQRAMQLVDKEVAKAQKSIKGKQLDISEAQKIIDSLMCK